jgi:hypothetical protein
VLLLPLVLVYLNWGLLALKRASLQKLSLSNTGLIGRRCVAGFSPQSICAEHPSYAHPNPTAAGFIGAIPAAKFRIQGSTKQNFPNGFKKSGGTIFERKRLATAANPKRFWLKASLTQGCSRIRNPGSYQWQLWSTQFS